MASVSRSLPRAMDYSLDGLAVLSTFVSETGNVQKIVALCQGRLNEKIALLEQLALEANNNNTTTLRDVKQAINDTTQEMKEISEALGTVRGRWFVRAPANERSTTKAKQVFETTELLELILLNLGTQDLMQAQLVNRTMRTTITASIALQNLLFLRAEPSDAFFRGLGLYHPSASISFHCYADPYGFRNPTLNFSRNENEVEVTAKFESGFHSRNLPKLGGRLRSMFICQPPLKEMKPAVRCCSAHTPRTVAAAQARVIELDPVQSDKGLTVGDILDATKKLREEHRLCPFAHESDHDEQGYVECMPVFRAFIQLQESDPTAKRQRKENAEYHMRKAKSMAKRQRFRPYIQAKLHAYSNGLRIPTLAEFEASNDATSTG